MAESAGTAAAASGSEGATAQPAGDSQAAGFTPPAEWLESDHYKPFIKEDKSFDIEGLGKKYAELAQQVPVIPAKADDYSFEFPQDFQVDEAALQLHRQMAKELGLTQAQYEGVTKHELQAYAAKAEAEAKQLSEAKNALVKEWGGQQQFETRIGKCREVAARFFGKEIVDKHDLANDPVFVKGLWAIASTISEDKLKQGSQSGANERPLGIDGRPRLRFKSMGE